MIDHIDDVLRARPTGPDLTAAWMWLSRAQSEASLVIRNRRLLFWKMLRGFATMRDAKTGEITPIQLPQIDWIVFPFHTIVDEAARVAEAIQ